MSTKLDVTFHSSKIEPDQICTLYVYLKGISVCVCVCGGATEFVILQHVLVGSGSQK